MEVTSERQLKLMGAGYILDATLISLPAMIIGAARQDAWLCYPIAFCILLIPLWCLSKALLRFPDGGDLFQAMVGRYKLIGRVISLLYFLWFFYILSRDLRMVIDFTNVTLLPRTPLAMIGLMLTVTIIPMVRSGGEVIARTNEFFFPILVLAIMSIPFMTLQEFDMQNLMPIMHHSWTGIIKGTWVALPYLGEIISLPLVAMGRIYTFGKGVRAFLLGTSVLELLILLNIFVLGPHISSRFVYPNHELVRQIRLTDFLDRFDLILVSIWLPAMLVKLGMTMYLLCRVIKVVVPGVEEKLMAAPIGFFALTCSFWLFQNAIQLNQINIGYPAICLPFLFILPVLIYLFLRPKRKDDPEEQPDREAQVS